MRILLTNDDGFFAEGISILEKIARNFSDDIWVVAPETDQSGYAHSLSLSNPLRLRQISDKHFTLRGTPTDCIIMAVRRIMPHAPDLILSGVNVGLNVCDDIIYSGTVAGAMEGAMLGIRSIALSQQYEYYEEKRHISYEGCAMHAPNLLKNLISMPIPQGVFLNVNYPSCSFEEIAGVKVTEQGRFDHSISTQLRYDGLGLPYYWLSFSDAKVDCPEGTDIHAIQNRFVSVAPLQFNLTDYSFKNHLKEHLL